MTTESKKNAPGSSGAAAGGPQRGMSPSDPPGAVDESHRVETPAETIERLHEELSKKTAEAAQNYDRALRARAELENYKKRVARDRAETQRFAAEQLVRDLLPIVDNLERAVEHAESGGNGQPLVEGVKIVLKSALDALERHGVTRIDAAGQRFDPAFHEAIIQVPDATREPNQVVRQFQPGYRLHERLLRPAQVSVSTGGPVENTDDDD